MASIGPWAPPSVPVVPPAGGCGLNQTEATVFRPAPTKSVRATTADHSKPNLARLYGGARSGCSAHRPLRWPNSFGISCFSGRCCLSERTPVQAMLNPSGAEGCPDLLGERNTLGEPLRSGAPFRLAGE